MRIELYRNPENFILQYFDNVDLELEVLKMNLFVRKVEVLDNVHMAIESVLKSCPLKYPIRRATLTNLHLANPARETPHQTLFFPDEFFSVA